MLAVSGRRGEARAILDQLKARAAQAYVPPANLALVHLALGEHEEALDRLEEAVDARDLLLTFLTVEPRWAGLAGRPRFTMLGKVGLKQRQRQRQAELARAREHPAPSRLWSPD